MALFLSEKLLATLLELSRDGSLRIHSGRPGTAGVHPAVANLIVLHGWATRETRRQDADSIPSAHYPGYRPHSSEHGAFLILTQAGRRQVAAMRSACGAKSAKGVDLTCKG